MSTEYPAPPPSQPPPPPQAKGFLGALFDLRFDSYVTPKVISLLYILGMIAIVIGFITSVVAGFNSSVGVGFLTLLILGPIGALLALTFLRVMLEYYLALVRLSGDFREWRREWRTRAP